MNKLASVMITLGMLFVTTAPVPALAAEPANDPLGLSYSAQSGLGSTDIRITIAKIIRVAMSLLGIIAVCIVLYGGFTWMTAGGNDEQVGEAKKWIFSGVIGLAIILSAWGITTYVMQALINATTSGETQGPLAPMTTP